MYVLLLIHYLVSKVLVDEEASIFRVWRGWGKTSGHLRERGDWNEDGPTD